MRTISLPDTSTWLPSLPLATLERYFKLRPDYLPLWQRIADGSVEFTTQETAQLILVESGAYMAMGSYGTALHLCRQALELGLETASQNPAADAWANIASILCMLGRFAESNAAAFESLAIDDSHYAAVGAWNSLALAGVYTNQFDEARQWFDLALSLSLQLNFEYGVARVLHNQSLIYCDRGEFELYISSAFESTRINQKIGGPIWPSVLAKVQIAILRGNRSVAREALVEYEGLGPQVSRVDGAIDLFRGQLAADEEDYEAAERYLQRALSVADSTGESSPAFAVKSAYGRLRGLQGDAAAAAGWGDDSNGQLGHNGNAQSPTPVSVIGLDADVTALAAGWYYNCALHASGRVKCWGSNSNGQIGNNTNADQKTSVQVVDRDAHSIAAGGYQTCAILNLGKARCWGKNSYGQLGDYTTTDRLVPVDVQGIYGFVQAVGTYGGLNSWAHSCALLSNGKVECWGNNYWGQLGDNTTMDHKPPAVVVGLDGVKRPEARVNYSTAKPGSPLVIVASDMPGSTGLTVMANGQPIPAMNFGGTLSTDANGQFQLGWTASLTVPTGMYAFDFDGSALSQTQSRAVAPFASAATVRASTSVWITTTAPLRDAPNPFPSTTLNSMPSSVHPFNLFTYLPNIAR